LLDTERTFYDCLQARGLQDISNENFEKAVKEVEAKFMLVLSGCLKKVLLDDVRCVVVTIQFVCGRTN